MRAAAVSAPHFITPWSLQCIITAAGKNFCAGLDLSYLTGTFGAKMQPQPQQQQSDGSQAQQTSCPARLRNDFRQEILDMQVGMCALQNTGGVHTLIHCEAVSQHIMVVMVIYPSAYICTVHLSCGLELALLPGLMAFGFLGDEARVRCQRSPWPMTVWRALLG